MTGPTGLASGVESGVFQTLAELVANNSVQQNTIVHVFELDNRGDYYVTAIDEGAGILLDNGLYANPAASDGGGHTMLMPISVTKANLLTIKASISEEYKSSEAGFYTALEGSFANSGDLYGAETLSPTADTTEQTIVNTGAGSSGVLLGIVTPRMSAAGNITVRVTADGVESVFVTPIPEAALSVAYIGGFFPWNANISAGAGYAQTNGFGFDEAIGMAMHSPADAISLGLPNGIVYEDSLVVTVQGDSALVAGATTHKAATIRLKYIPKGVV